MTYDVEERPLVKIAFGEIVHESNTFTSVRTGIDSFENNGFYQGSELFQKMVGVGPIGGFLKRVDESEIDYELIPLVRAYEFAGGVILKQTFDLLLEKLIVPLRNAGFLDGGFLSLHGAAVTENDDDLEGTILEIVREVVGRDALIVVSLDHHANITTRMVAAADMLVGHQSQPHDTFDTGLKSSSLFLKCLNDHIRPTLAWRKIPMITPQDHYLTSSGPMKDWFDRARILEQRQGVIDVSLYPMQPWLDVKEAGWSVVVHTVDLPELAEDLAEEMAEYVWRLRRSFWKSSRLAPDEAVRCTYLADKGLVILADIGDAVYAGASGDSTCLLKEFLNQSEGRTEMILLPMVDHEAVNMSFDTGIGGRVDLVLGGRLDNVFSSPVEVSAEVIALSEQYIADLGERGTCELGSTALIKIGGVYVVVMERAVAAINYPILYTHLGVNLCKAHAVVLKTGSNFQNFGFWCRRLIRVDSPGVTQSTLNAFKWNRIPRPIYPLDGDLGNWKV